MKLIFFCYILLPLIASALPVRREPPSLHLPHGSAASACESILAPKFEDLAMKLEDHANEHEGTAAFETASKLRVDFLELMNKCVADQSSFAEDELENTLLQVHQKWGFVKKHVVEPIKKNVVEPAKKHVVDPATKWLKNGPPAPPAGAPPKTYTSWKAVQQALALAAVVYQDEKAIDILLHGCADGKADLHTVHGKLNQAAIDTMQKYCRIYSLYKKIAFMDNGKSVKGKDVGTEALIVETTDDPVAEVELAAEESSKPQRKLLSQPLEELQSSAQDGAREEWGGSRRRRFHLHHRHRPHIHHRHRPHIHHKHHSHHKHHRHHTHHKHTPAPKYAVKTTGTRTKTGVVWIAIRGSEDLEDWKSNIKLTQTSWPDGGGGKVHQGFYMQYAQIRKTVFETVDKKVAEGWVNFHVTGHSLGGAVAELVAMAIIHRHPTVRVQMINFGAPMVGDKHWNSEFDRKIKLSTRVVNNKDLVTCLPGQNPVSGIASRIGNLVSSGSASNPYSTNVNHLLQWSNNAWRATRWPSCSRSWSVGDHDLDNYAKIVLGKARCQHSCYQA